MLLRLSRASFWLAAAVAALALLAPGGHESLLFGIVLAACALAYGTWRSALRTEQRRPAVSQLPAHPAPLTGGALDEAALALVDCARSAGSFEAALHAVARLLRSELGPREVTVHEVSTVDATHVALRSLIETQPGFRTVARRVRLDTVPLGRAVSGRCETGVPPAAVAVPVLRFGRVVAVLELVGIDLPLELDAIAPLLEQARLTLSERAAAEPGEASGPLHANGPGIEDNGAAAHPAPPAIAPAGPARDDKDKDRIRELGFDDCLAKPFSPSPPHAMLTRHQRPQAPSGEAGGSAAPVPAPAAGLDPDALARLTELDPSGANKLLERVLQAFQTSAARLHSQLLAARGSGDRAAIRLVAHTLKSSSASIGALQLSQLCAGVETAIRLDTGAHLDADLDALDTALDATLRSIKRLLEQRA